MNILEKLKILLKPNKTSTIIRYYTCFERLIHIKTLGFEPYVIFDCGAYLGSWALKVSKIFPRVQFLLLEPNTMITGKTKTNVSLIKPNAILVETAIGEKAGKRMLNIWDNDQTSMAGSSLLNHIQGKAKTQIEVPIDTLDNIASKNNLIPNLIKLDLQGAELFALKGAKQLLKDTELFIIEFGCLEAYKDRTTPLDIMEIMYDNNYSLYDIVDLIYRPYDNALTGGDFFFIKNNSPLKSYKGYR